MQKTDLIIIGGGVLGTFHALHALSNGLSVRLFERHNTPRGATVRNFGQIVPSGMTPEWQRYGIQSLSIYQKLQRHFDITLRNEGSIYIASDADELQLLEEMHAINIRNAYPSELLTREQCLARYPGLKADYCMGGLFYAQEVTVESRVMIQRVLDYLVTEKKLLYHAATTIKNTASVNEHCEVLTNRNEVFTAEKVLICGGHEFETLYPYVFAESDLEISMLQMMQTRPQPTQRIPGNILTGLSIRRYESFRGCPSYNTIKTNEDPEAPWKKWGVHILFKQSPDGSVIIGDSHRYADATRADLAGFDIYPEINRYMLQEAARIFDLQDYTLQREWYGIYSQCKTRDIFVHSPERNIHIVTGIGGKGMTAGPGFAQEHTKQLFNLN